MPKLYTVIVNALLFFFIISVFNGVQLTSGTLLAKVFVSVIFGVLIMLIPNVLGILKINDSTGARLLVSLVISFLFFFVLYAQVGNLARVTASSIDLGFGPGSVISLPGAVETLIAAAVLSAFASAGLQSLSKKA